jgi:hypothetical protein
VVLALLLAIGTAPGERTVVIDGKPLFIESSAAAPGTALPINLLVSADERAVSATLLHGGWTPEDPLAQRAYPEIQVRLAGRPPDLDLEHSGPHVDERLRLLLWRRPERLRGLPLWVGVALHQGGVRPLLPPTRAPTSAQEAADRVLADFSFGLSQSRTVATGPRITWVELAEPPPGAEDLLLDLPPATEPRLEPAGPHPAGPPPLLPLPPLQPVAAEIIAGLRAKGFVLSQVGEMVGDAPAAR